MKIQGEHHFQAPRDQVWKAVLDPKTLFSSLPGFQRLDTIGDHEYVGALEIKVGSVRADFQGTLKLSDLKPPSSYRFSLNGMGAAGFVDGDGLLVLEDSGGGTRIHYDLDARVGGRIAGVGQDLLDSSAQVMARQALEGLERQFAKRTQVRVVTKQEAAPPGVEVPATPVEPTETAELPAAPADVAPVKAAPSPFKTAAIAGPPNQAKFAFGFVKNLAGGLVAPAKSHWVLAGALIAYTIVVILLTRACSG